MIGNEKIVIKGENASGKSTLIKAILQDPNVRISGTWHIPKIQDIGYLDQHYKTLIHDKTVLESIEEVVSGWSEQDICRHLNDFLFRHKTEVNALVSSLSGGEKARLSLAKIAACTPKLLILDEITNNIDLETKEHIIQVLNEYSGAMIVISHDEGFLKKINLTTVYEIKNKVISSL